MQPPVMHVPLNSPLPSLILAPALTAVVIRGHVDAFAKH